MNTYFLRDGVFFCGRGDAVIFLNLKRDEYSMLCGRDAAIFRSCFLAHLAPCAVSGEVLPPEAITRVVRELTENGILTTQATDGKKITPTHVEAVSVPLLPADPGLRAEISIGALLRFALACLVATLRLKTQSIDRTVSAIRRRKEARGEVNEGGQNLRRTRELVATFDRLRAFFPKSYLCLFDSLALLEFLARYDIYPQWVFAVQIEPWAAHCWVQAGEVIFNDDVEETSDYIPIMAV